MFALNINNETSSEITWNEDTDISQFSGLVWLHFEGEINTTRQWLISNLTLDTNTINALCDELTRPRVFVNATDELIVTLRAIHSENTLGAELFSLRAWMVERFLITISKVKLAPVAAIEDKIKRRAKGIYSSYQLFSLLCDITTNHITSYLADLDESLNFIEDEWDSQHKIDIDKLHSLRFDMSRLRRFLLPQLETLQRIPTLVKNELDISKELSLNTTRWHETVNVAKRDIETLAEMRERVMILRDAVQQHSSESINRTMFLLSVVATFFLPLTFLASLLGMNVSGIPGQEATWAFWGVCGLMIFVASLQLILFKYWKWLK